MARLIAPRRRSDAPVRRPSRRVLKSAGAKVGASMRSMAPPVDLYARLRGSVYQIGNRYNVLALFGSEEDEEAYLAGVIKLGDLFDDNYGLKRLFRSDDEEDEAGQLFGDDEEASDLFGDGEEEEEAGHLFGGDEEASDLFGDDEEASDHFGDGEEAEEAGHLFGDGEEAEEAGHLFGGDEKASDLFGDGE